MNYSRPVNVTDDRSYILLTGGTGLVGQYLLKDFLSKGTRLAVVVRPNKKLSAQQRIEATLQKWERKTGKLLPRPVILVGNINQPMLGLSDLDQSWVANHCHSILHNAAILKFSGSDRKQEPWRTNCGGTQNMIDLAAETNIKHLHYVSTAYVCGVRDSVVMESDLDVGQTFRNDYEGSKFEAEQLVARADHFETKTIYRPAVIVGDSQTGYTSTYHGMFLYLRLLSTLIPLQRRDKNGIYQTPIRLPMTGDEPRNLVPVDWVSQVICHLVTTKSAHGKTFHLVPDKCSTTRVFIDACCEYFNSGGVQYAGTGERVGHSKFAALFFQSARIYQEYETSDPHFDKSNLRKFAGHLACPAIDSQMIQRFIAFGELDKWGRKKVAAPRPTAWIQTESDRLCALVSRLFSSNKNRILGSPSGILEVGINVIGPGGGQWTFSGQPGQPFYCTPGLPSSQSATLTIDSNSLLSILGEFESFTGHAATGQWETFADKIGAAMTFAPH